MNVLLRVRWWVVGLLTFLWSSPAQADRSLLEDMIIGIAPEMYSALDSDAPVGFMFFSRIYRAVAIILGISAISAAIWLVSSLVLPHRIQARLPQPWHRWAAACLLFVASLPLVLYAVRNFEMEKMFVTALCR